MFNPPSKSLILMNLEVLKKKVTTGHAEKIQ
jgi:hypothetical protein